ncbi:maltose/moltooligosaccharide transporter [Sphingobacterium paludis]|uniref:Maltose/moltooligosaccharide transporter n=2 Tax=Sphingobacterium paludis TaxID=1476465 RepID=A0A4R7CV39_9SPHI|nr:maltose/moltooligosaccharide transporter [Sphingobacterium paludis]
MSFGFLGIQMGFALQNGNASRILQTFGADVEHLSLFWLAAPLTGMIVQPIIGHYSDRTWNSLGRRRPYFLGGALFTAIALIFMPNSAVLAAMLPPLLIGAGMLMIMDASINITMEPFRALIADNLPSEQRSLGFSMQTFLIGLGAVLGSWLPYILAEYGGVSKVADAGLVPNNVIYSFYVGAAVLILSILWTVFTTKEYSPEELERFESGETAAVAEPLNKRGFFKGLTEDIKNMPLAMRQLGLVQFCSWFALFLMWVFSTPAIAEHIYTVPAGDTTSVGYADAGNWVGVLFGIYNGVSAIYALCLPRIARAIGRKSTHALSLTIGGMALGSIYFMSTPEMLILSMVGIGVAWGSILAMPYAILSDSLPARKMGLYMGLFNFFITFPQIVSGLTSGYLIKYVFQGQAIYALLGAGVLMIIGAISVRKIKV